VVGVAKPESLEGKSLLPVIQGKTKAVRDTVMLGYRDVQRAVRQGRWKLLRYPQIDRTQLFDLQADPFEIHDLAAQPQQRARIEKMMQLLREQQKQFGDTLPLTAEHVHPGDITIDFFSKKKAG
jgi:arylsulfatase A-like enzyme